MKKILFLLLLTVSGYGQTLQSPTYNATTTNTLKIKTPATVTSVNFLSTNEADGSISKISAVNLPLTTANLKAYNGDKKIVKYVKKAVFSFIWDDVQTSDPLVYNVFQEFGYIPSYAITTNNLNSGNVGFYIDAYNKGCSILAHSVSHPDMSGTTLTNAQVNTQMVTSKNIIEGYGMRVSGWVTPSSTLNAIYYPQVDKNFGYAFTSTGGAFNETVSPLRLSRVGLESAMAGHNLANVQAIIDDAITNNKMVVFYGHHLPSTYLNPDTTPYLTEADLRDILTYLKTKSDENLCEVMTTDEAIQTYYGFSSGVEGNLVKWTGRNTQSNSIISDDGNSAIVTGLFRTNGNVNFTYLPSIGSASNGNVASFNNVVNSDGIASIINFNSPRSGGANASVYFGALNTSTDYRSITVLGRRTGLATWLESARIDYDGRLLFGTQTNNGVDIAQFNGTVSGSDATLANQFTTKAQLDLKQNTITNPVTGTGTTNFISKWSSSSVQANSGIFDNGTNVGFGESTIFNDYVTIKNGSPTLLGLYNSQDIATTVASGILSLGQMSSTTKIPAADISGFLAVVGNDTNGIFRIRTRRAGTMTEAVRVFASGGVSIGNTTDPGTTNLSVTGNASSASKTITTAPTTSAGTYDFLTRNTSTGVVEKVLSSTIATTSNTILTTTNQGFSGIKSSTNTGATQINGLDLTNNGTSGSQVYKSTNSSTGDGNYSVNTGGGNGTRTDNTSIGKGFYTTNSSTGMGYYSANQSSGIGIYSENTGSSNGSAIVANTGPSAIGLNFEGQNNGSRTFSVAKNGVINGVTTYNALITQSGTGAPTVSVLGNNTIGAIVWTRTATGSYTGTLSGAFTASKTMIFINNTVVGSITTNSPTANTVTLTTADSTGTLLDGRLTANSLKIEVYP